MDIYETIRNMLFSNKVIDKWTESLSEIKTINNNDNEKDIKEKIIHYLNEKGLPLTQDNYDLAINMLYKQETINYKTNKSITHNELENVKDENLNDWLQAKMVILLFELKQKIIESNYMTYDVDVITDKSNGEIDEPSLRLSLLQHSRNGWRVKSITTNELGKEEHGGSIGPVSTTKNATRSQIVIVYERPFSLTDQEAQEYIEKIINSKKASSNQ